MARPVMRRTLLGIDPSAERIGSDQAEGEDSRAQVGLDTAAAQAPLSCRRRGLEKLA